MEDLGYLPELLFNLDHTFKNAALVVNEAFNDVCMGFGCNAAGTVLGCGLLIHTTREINCNDY